MVRIVKVIKINFLILGNMSSVPKYNRGTAISGAHIQVKIQFNPFVLSMLFPVRKINKKSKITPKYAKPEKE